MRDKLEAMLNDGQTENWLAIMRFLTDRIYRLPY